MKQSEKHEGLSRRAFLRQGALASFGVGLLPFAGGAGQLPQDRAEVRRYVPLGRTGIQISDISFGASRLDAGQEAIVLHAFERGINYFDTADSYSGGDSERTIGNEIGRAHV